MGCIAALLAMLAGFFLFILIGVAITSWLGAFFVSLGLLIVVARRVWLTRPHRGSHVQ